jgi:hypothetical protein
MKTAYSFVLGSPRPFANSAPIRRFSFAVQLPGSADHGYHCSSKVHPGAALCSRGWGRMNGLSIWHWLIIVMLATTVANGFIASRKNRSVVNWVILGLMFNPIAFVVLLFLPSRKLYLP